MGIVGVKVIGRQDNTLIVACNISPDGDFRIVARTDDSPAIFEADDAIDEEMAVCWEGTYFQASELLLAIE